MATALISCTEPAYDAEAYRDPVENCVEKLAALALGTPCFDIDDRDRHDIIDLIMPDACEDLAAYHSRDPSIRRKPIACLISPHSTYFAVLAYRIAHLLAGTGTFGCDTITTAMRLSFYARSQTGVDIHPEAEIGRRLVIDHGWGTVIGQTTQIGDDCYLLNDVTLGGRHAADAPDGKRHPTIGHRVQLCARAKVLGPISIGDDVFIGPDVLVTEDVPARTSLLSGPTEHLSRSTRHSRVLAGA